MTLVRGCKADFLRAGPGVLELGKPGRTGLKPKRQIKPHTGRAGRSPASPCPILKKSDQR